MLLFIIILTIKIVIIMVHVISDGEYVKIGKSNDVRKRLQALQTGNARNLKVLYVYDVDDKYEDILHKKFKRYRSEAANEWFKIPSNRLEEYLLRLDKSLFDTAQAAHKAKLINVSIYKNIDKIGSVKRNTNKVIRTGKPLTKKRILVIEGVKEDLKDKNKVISYDKYILSTGLSKSEISLAIKKANLSKLVFEHNARLRKGGILSDKNSLEYKEQAVLKDIRNIIEKGAIVLSYAPLMRKYNLSKDHIASIVSSNNLGYKVFMHNKKFKRR